ncbi:MAG: 10 kDa chaperonin [candidate division WWE3 bacterium GW2011_GWA1_41_8]|uniref:Co-chaperonin GroES n=2 Tax=Katanobacteria TaxID=422282 RepID=A0A0G0XBG9_UNCKA|nr:MAG: 10 kDa chaperonin [candidate division WWE3 bacterium GW2011_GWA1_41_8]OGC57075.1 MAG: co-chaperone GroES [candidate division WWE3 bacterium RIFCSPLOWO2_01_FULL_41_9]
MSQIKPLSDYVLIEPMDSQTTTPSGIVIPDTAKEKPQQGRVIAAGPGKTEDGKTTPLQVAVGQVVMYKKWGGTEVRQEGKDYLLVKEEDILAIVEE